MKIRVGFEIAYDCLHPTPMLLMLDVHPSRTADIVSAGQLTCQPALAVNAYTDGFGNRCSRIVAPPGRIQLSNDLVVNDSGLPDTVAFGALQHIIPDLPDDALVYLLGSRYCETDRFYDIAWSLFQASPLGWGRVQAICDFVHRQIVFGYQHARATKTAWDAYMERQGVCRDFAHLAITLCRCMNIPARYCSGYLGDIGVPADPAPMDFSAWFEAYLGGRWYTFDARHNTPRIGRILMGTGRDAADVALTTSFGRMTLAKFVVVTDEVVMA